MPFGTASTVLVSSEIHSKAQYCQLDATGTKKQKQKLNFTLKQDPWCQNGEQNGGGGPLTFGAASEIVTVFFFSPPSPHVPLKISLPFAPLSLLYCLSCHIKVKLCWLYHLQSRGVQIKSRGMEMWGFLLFYKSLFVSLVSVPLFSQLNDVRTLNDSERGQKG